MQSRVVFLIAAGSCALAGVLFACSSDSSGGFDDGTDASADTGVGTKPVEGGTVDGSMQPQKDGGGGGNVDSGMSAGHCTPLMGPCDIVAQDCPTMGGQKQECVATMGANNTFTTVCVAPQASEQLPLGKGCCPSNNSNPCLPGLECIGDTCTEGGAPTGRCSPHCCIGQDGLCGASDPEGISGACDITITSGNTDLYYVCTYKDYCTPLGVKPCKEANSECVVTEKTALASTCNPVLNPPAAGEHGECSSPFVTCMDGTMCFLRQYLDGGIAKLPDGGDSAECLYLCNTPASSTPFDGGLLDGAPGHGGCPAGESCKGTLNPADFPAWLSICLP